MNIFERLTREHQLIRRYLDTVHIVLECMKAGHEVSTSFFRMGLDFTRTFSDTYHHYKEEYIMFRDLAMQKEGVLDSRIMLLRNQHERARNHISEIGGVIGKYKKDDIILNGDDRKAILLGLQNYNRLLRQHIHEEDHVFYPMAKQVFYEEELSAISDEFDRFEQKYSLDCFSINTDLVDQMEELLRGEIGEAYHLKMVSRNSHHSRASVVMENDDLA